MTKTKSIDVGLVAIVLGIIGWFVNSSTLVWIGWWLVFGFQMFIAGVVLVMVFFGRHKVKMEFSPPQTNANVLKGVVFNVVMILVWWKTYIPLHYALLPLIFGLLFKAYFKRNVLPSL